MLCACCSARLVDALRLLLSTDWRRLVDTTARRRLVFRRLSLGLHDGSEEAVDEETKRGSTRKARRRLSMKRRREDRRERLWCLLYNGSGCR
jgi:hypothetical protein